MPKTLRVLVIVSICVSCEGPEGPMGRAGGNSVLKLSTELAGMNCSAGGVRIDSGLDSDSDGILDAQEIDVTNYVCNGQNGISPITNVVAELAGINCKSGGVKIESGSDLNNNRTLDAHEIENTTFLCNGAQGNSSFIKSTPEPIGGNCLNGGFKIETGNDTNADGFFDANEVTSVSFICHANTDQTEKQIRFLIASMGTSGQGASGTTGYLFGNVAKFDKRHYSGVSSIIFSPKVSINNALYPAYAELYNLTDNVVITGSTVSPTASAAYDPQILESANILNSLPNKEISLAIRVRTGNSATSLYLTGETYLILQRN